MGQVLVIGILHAWLNNHGAVAALTGDRAHPALMSLLAYGLFWLLITGLMRWRQQQPAA